MTSKRKAAISKKKILLKQALELKHYLLKIEIDFTSCQHYTSPKYIVFSVYIVSYCDETTPVEEIQSTAADYQDPIVFSV